MHNELLLELASATFKAIEKSFNDHGLTQEDIYSSLSVAPNIKMGHFAFPCFPLAKALRMGPPQIAGKIAEELAQMEGLSFEVAAMGPYLNYKVSSKLYQKSVIAPILNGEFFNQSNPDYPKTMIEYSQPNTHKVLHVGHMRNLCFGNALVKMHQYLGHDVTPVTYPGDVGTHVAKCLWYLKKTGEKPTETEDRGAWLGKIYSTANHLLEDELGTDKEAQNRTELTAILKELESGSGEYFELWQETRLWSLDLMKEAYDWAGVEFDRWFFESEVDKPSVELAREYYDKGIFVEDDGAIGCDLKEEKLGFCIMIKSDGNGLYATKDVLLAKKKFEEFKVEQNVYIVDERQSFHFKQVFKTLEKIGFEQAKKCLHVPYDVVELPDGAMSSRKGNIIPLMTLVKTMEQTITERYLESYRGDWSDQQIEETAKIIANGAIKYGMTKVDNNRKIIFDMDEWLKLEGDTGPYLQYVTARINSIQNKLGPQIEKSENDFDQLEKTQEVALMIKLSQFNEIVKSSAEQFKTLTLGTYLFELAKLYNSFYAECSIAKAESKELMAARFDLSVAVHHVMEKGLNLLGITAPKQM